MRLCTVPGCGRKHHARGLCKPHIQTQERRAAGIQPRKLKGNETIAAMREQKEFDRQQREAREEHLRRLISERLPLQVILARHGVDKSYVYRLARRMKVTLTHENDWPYFGLEA